MPSDLTLLMAFATGLFGAGHCLGMCGGLAGGYFIQRRQAATLATQIGYHASRLATYSFLGLAGALAGRVLAQSGLVGKGQGLLMMAAGLLILGLGLRLALGVRPRELPASTDSRKLPAVVESPEIAAPTASSRGIAAPARSSREILSPPASQSVRLERRVLSRRPWAPPVMGAPDGPGPRRPGLFLGLQAAPPPDPVQAALFMFVFGLGPLPMMVAVTWAGAASGARVSGIFARLAGGLVVLMGLWTLYEGYIFFDIMRGLANG